MQKRFRIAIALLSLPAVSACVSGQEAARLRAAREYNCPEDRISTKYLGESQIGELWQVRACGVVATYACASTSAEGECVRESDDRADE